MSLCTIWIYSSMITYQQMKKYIGGTYSKTLSSSDGLEMAASEIVVLGERVVSFWPPALWHSSSPPYPNAPGIKITWGGALSINSMEGLPQVQKSHGWFPKRPSLSVGCTALPFSLPGKRNYVLSHCSLFPTGKAQTWPSLLVPRYKPLPQGLISIKFLASFQGITVQRVAKNLEELL